MLLLTLPTVAFIAAVIAPAAEDQKVVLRRRRRRRRCRCCCWSWLYTDGLTTSQCSPRNRNAGNHVGERFWKRALFCE